MNTVVNRKRTRTNQPSVPDSLFPAVECQRFGRATCFLCGRRLGSQICTEEHVFPRWLQERFGLWTRRLKLLNETWIPYRQLTIPCCVECNGTHLSALEAEVTRAVSVGPDAVARLAPHVLMLWLSKLMYGLLYKEGLLRRDRRNPCKGPIVGRGVLERFAMLHYFLQGARLRMRFDIRLPASIFVFSV